MAYSSATLKVLTGVVVAYLGYLLATRPSSGVLFLYGGIIILIGLGLAVHSLFTGIETAVAAGIDRPEAEEASES